jgi:hypothetical protein
VERSVEEGQPRADLGGADRVVEDLTEEELGFTRLDQKDNLPLREVDPSCSKPLVPSCAAIEPVSSGSSCFGWFRDAKGAAGRYDPSSHGSTDSAETPRPSEGEIRGEGGTQRDGEGRQHEDEHGKDELDRCWLACALTLESAWAFRGTLRGRWHGV